MDERNVNSNHDEVDPGGLSPATIKSSPSGAQHLKGANEEQSLVSPAVSGLNVKDELPSPVVTETPQNADIGKWLDDTVGMTASHPLIAEFCNGNSNMVPELGDHEAGAIVTEVNCSCG